MMAVQRPGLGLVSNHCPTSRWPADAALIQSLNPGGMAPREVAADEGCTLSELGDVLDRFIAATTPVASAPVPVAAPAKVPGVRRARKLERPSGSGTATDKGSVSANCAFAGADATLLAVQTEKRLKAADGLVKLGRHAEALRIAGVVLGESLLQPEHKAQALLAMSEAYTLVSRCEAAPEGFDFDGWRELCEVSLYPARGPRGMD